MSKSLGNGVDPQETSKSLGAEIIRLWVAASDYSGDIAGDKEILKRVVDAYRRIRNTLRFLLANVSDFDPAKDAVPLAEMFEIDRYAMSRAAQFQQEVLAHYEVYEFHPVVAKLQVYCSEDLGAFYLDVLKDRLYTTPPKSLARRSAQTALWNITHAMLRWMAPFLSFTAEEAWKIFGDSESIFLETYAEIGGPDAALIDKWTHIRAAREMVNKKIESLREGGQVGSSLQANVELTVPMHQHPELFEALASLEEDLRFVLITSKAEVLAGEEMRVDVKPSLGVKCERCWHWREDVGADKEHPLICGRCTANLFGDGEPRKFA
jgi:isoleucyl-tRNA synthetase